MPYEQFAAGHHMAFHYAPIFGATVAITAVWHRPNGYEPVEIKPFVQGGCPGCTGIVEIPAFFGSHDCHDVTVS